MKRIIPLLFLFAQVVVAQQIEVEKVTQLAKQQRSNYAWVNFVPQSNNLLCSTIGYKGLYLLDTKSGKATTITDKDGAGYKPTLGKTGQVVVYRATRMINSRKHGSLHSFNLETSSTTEIVSEARGVSSPVLKNGLLHYTISGKKRTLLLEKRTQQPVFVVSEGLQPMLHKNNTVQAYTPSGKGNYIWASVSPDGSMMVYNFNGRGTFVADLNGNILASLGNLHAPKWMTNQYIVGMNDKDDGERVISSDIVAYSLSTNSVQNLTKSSDRLEMYPAVSQDGSRIAFHTEKGEIYIMNIAK